MWQSTCTRRDGDARLASTGADPSEHMPHEHEGLLRRYIHEVWECRNPAAAVEFLSEDYARHVSPVRPPLRRSDQIELLHAFHAAFPDISIEVQDMVVGGDRIAFRSVMRGTHRGPILGLEPTGRRVEVSLLDIWRIRHGRVVEQWGGPDTHDLTRQLGAA